MILDKTRVLIKTENLKMSYNYKDDVVEVLKDIDIRVLQGEFIIIKGINGVEKNAFFNLMGCIERPTAGKLYFDYDDIGLASSEMMDSIRKYKLGYLFRNFNLISSMSVNENLTIPLRGLNISRDKKISRLKQVMEQLDISDVMGERICDISSIKKQLVALARAIINNPLMIIAEEPTANLNIDDGQKLIKYLWELNQEGITIMLISEKKDCVFPNESRYIYFENGRISNDAKEKIIYPMKGALI